ncbi:2-oxo-4-hydroxy-4-carboxy-5-ureidoimidazoline decarboxylase [Actinomadura sp. 7K507]|uniref:2-oxo-4-hydroxy-4-carboxy-5-ureidoimidazoline decarboxylase n=1 Tax=Actinomadura sp. 7K507 TaxID=2530365 RepID=UPI001045F8D3|nr:2-oxo-4-hydroxy-4-carboxy-5-ureidoimidazoline decarboxylase [Actinomadura sp. 7K507]TDC89243.1 2-oxo-4-hydroxy-4-carboxy-5-ureidoimidazoline decarboxylase [Actinomadura sp. 7K507]
MLFTETELSACCASRRWVAAVAGRPYRDAAELRAAGASALDGLEWADVQEALADHPRIGERVKKGTWSRGEQSGMDAAEAEVRAALVAGNRAYEERFGHVFLVCASGRGAGEMLGDLRERLGNDTGTERAVVRRELAKIVDLRLAKLTEEEP